MLGLGHWYPISCADSRARYMLSQHYSSKNNHPLTPHITPPGEDMVLMTVDSRALWAWSIEHHRSDGQEGINCTVFRNETDILSSDLIREADELADARWGRMRHFTYVDGSKVKSRNPGYCFIAAGWQPCGYSKKGLRILERV